MTTRTSRRRALTATAIAVALTTGTSVALTGSASAQPAASTATTVSLATGQYQSAYSERNDVLWVTTAVGRNANPSALLKVDPRTLTVEQSITPPVANPTTGALEAVYGVAVDDEHNTVWVTNTRVNTVAVYSQRTGEHLATLPDVAHAREIVVDEKHDTVWASAYGGGTLVAYDSKTLTEKKRVTVEGSGPAGLAVDEKSGTVYATDLTNDRIIEVTRASDTPRLIPAGDGPISIALSRNGRTAYTADQTGGTLSVVDLRTGTVTRTVTTGAGALSVAASDRSGDVVVVNRTAATATVVDPGKGVVEETVPTGTNPNHVEITDGVAYVVDKSGAGENGADTLTVIDLAH
ncbi:beta-propeller fold lactonase family protein [Streptomyces phaeoluteigriseus]|uniref:Beta-propeller fold lactonase family protein n=1 Tax=Streptomyces phaeoluteigriseus TaxID=114686 RepID=A0ABY4Z863_9ACTN|nr:beta-propeller fold lactonase family protein [Streptomyces phaeoluteigriseus]USQ85067.1 beta-propeller fold lactonase family protein [Streptomyces phaeoluteigriseus]